jgi:pimeloyl-ACP methyl ester carboxylesterase
VKKILWAFGIIFGLILAAALIVPFLIPIPQLEGLVSVQELADPDSHFIMINGLRVHYKSDGSKEPALLLLHGFGASLYSWREVSAPLAENHFVAAFDRPAFGLTERPMEWGAQDYSSQNPYSAEFQALLTVGLMDSFGLDQAVLIGNSAGGSIAVLTALTYPDRVQALILVDPAIYSGGGSPSWARPLLNTPQIKRLGPLIARRIQDWGRDFALSAWHDPSGLTDEIWQEYTKPLKAENWDRALWHLTVASHDLELDQKLNQLTLPVLVITGDDDRIVPTEDSIRLASELPNADLVVIPNCGHVPHEECPSAFLEATEGFLEGLITE